LQRSALGDVGAGVVQRNYGAMSQAPALHLGRLVSNAKNHLQKLDAGLAFWFEEQIADIAVCIGDAAPRALTLEQQSLFALGYYQQLAHSRQRKADKPGMTPDTTSNERPEG
jgi:CRISPR-associated protein Csd1